MANEWHEQRDLIAWFKAVWPEHTQAIRCSMNGLNLGGSRTASIMIKQMRAQGMVDGESDLMFAIPRGGFGCLVLEHKAEGSAHKLTPKQADYLKYHDSIGNCALCTCGIKQAKKIIRGYMENENTEVIRYVRSGSAAD